MTLETCVVELFWIFILLESLLLTCTPYPRQCDIIPNHTPLTGDQGPECCECIECQCDDGTRRP